MLLFNTVKKLTDNNGARGAVVCHTTVVTLLIQGDLPVARFLCIHTGVRALLPDKK